jgi:hypothetical protein
MPWHIDAPVGSISVRANRTLLNDNFVFTQDNMRVNHYFNESNDGKHRLISMPQTTDPAPVANQIDLYNKASSIGVSELWMIRDAEPLTKCALTNSLITVPQNLQNGYSWLPGGMLMQWGFRVWDNVNDGSTAKVSLPTRFSVNNADAVGFIAIAIPVHSSSSPGSDFETGIVTGSLTHEEFKIANFGGHTMAGWYWLAIGPKT